MISSNIDKHLDKLRETSKTGLHDPVKVSGLFQDIQSIMRAMNTEGGSHHELTDKSLPFYNSADDTMKDSSLEYNGTDIILGSGQFKFQGGTNSLPSITFDGDSDTGFYQKSGDTISVTIGGTKRYEFNAFHLDMKGRSLKHAKKLLDSNENDLIDFIGTASAVNYFQLTNAATGGNPIIETIGGDVDIDLRLDAKGNGFVVSESILSIQDGTTSTPAILFDSDKDTGIYKEGVNNLGISVGGSKVFNINGKTAYFTGVDLSMQANDIITDATTGMKIATAISQKLGFFNATPVVQQSAPNALTDNSGGTTDDIVAAVSGSGADVIINNNFAELVEEVNQIRTVLTNLGLAG